MDVAVKMLKEGAKEKDRVKFLQEAAINGQFHHPSIIKLQGVVTIGEPVKTIEFKVYQRLCSVYEFELLSKGYDCPRFNASW